MPYKDPAKHRACSRAKDDLIQWMLRQIKSDNPCADCGKSFPWYAMEFHHREKLDPTRYPASTSHRYRRPCVSHANSWTLVFKELKDCDVLCAVCHRIRSFLCGEWGIARDLC